MVKLMDSDWFEQRKQWDRYKRFYAERDYGIVQFDTGEVILTRAKFRPDARCRTYGNLVFLMGADQHNVLNCLYDTVNDRKVRKSWLHDGCYFVADMDTRQFISLYSYAPIKDHPHIPHYLARFNPVAYHGGPGRKWHSAVKLAYTRTLRPDKEQHKHVQNIIMLCKAQQRVVGIPENARFTDVNPHWSAWGAPSWLDVVNTTFEALSLGERDIIARYGVKPPREYVEVSELEIRET